MTRFYVGPAYTNEFIEVECDFPEQAAIKGFETEWNEPESVMEVQPDDEDDPRRWRYTRGDIFGYLPGDRVFFKRIPSLNMLPNVATILSINKFGEVKLVDDETGQEFVRKLEDVSSSYRDPEKGLIYA